MYWVWNVNGQKWMDSGPTVQVELTILAMNWMWECRRERKQGYILLGIWLELLPRWGVVFIDMRKTEGGEDWEWSENQEFSLGCV